METATPIASEIRDRLAALHPGAFGWAMCCSGHRREEARDILQTTYWKVLRGQARWGGQGDFRAWLFGVIRNTAREHLRRERRWNWRFPSWDDSGEPRPEPAAEVPAQPGDNPAVAELRAALPRLPERQREILHLVFYENFTIDAAGGLLGISPGTARTHYERGKSRLRQLLNPSRHERQIA